MAQVQEQRPVAVLSCAGTNRGLVRQLNEDSLLAEYPVFVVADGMGGHAGGELASAATVAAFRPLVGRQDVAPEEIPALIDAAQLAVAKIGTNGGAPGAGCTLTGAVAVRTPGQPPFWLVFNVGDSRTYTCYGGVLTQISVDHSLLQEMHDNGQLVGLSPDQYPPRNIITRAIGGDDYRAEYWSLTMSPGQRLLMCSDGLTGEISDTVIADELSQPDPVEATAANLIEFALDEGGRDNISVIVVEVEGRAAGAPPVPQPIVFAPVNATNPLGDNDDEGGEQ